MPGPGRRRAWALAVKIADGAGRGAEVAMAHVLRRMGAVDDGTWQALAPWHRHALRNWAGTQVGEIRATDALLA